MTYMIEFIDKDIKSIFIIIFHIAKKLEERLNMLSRDMKDIKVFKSNF